VIELTNRVVKHGKEITALKDLVALLENQLKEYASSAKMIETWEKDFQLIMRPLQPQSKQPPQKLAQNS